MAVYYGVIVSVVIFGLLAQFVNSKSTPKEIVSSNGTIKYKNKYSIFYPILIGIFVFVGGFRYYVGTDFGGYYKSYTGNWSEVISLLKELNEPGLRFVAFIARNIWDDGVSVIFFSCLFITLLVFYGISKFDNNDITVMLLIYIFIAGWLFSFNGVRQAFAASIIFAFAKVNDKHWIFKYLLLCFIAFLFHESALMMIPVLLLSHRKIDKTQIFLLIVSAFVVPLLFDFVFRYMGVNLESEESLVYIQREINPIRVVVSFAPLILLLFIENKKDFFEKNEFAVNITILNALLTLTTMNSAYLNRFTQYTSMFLMIYYPAVFKSIPKSIRQLVTIVVLIFYFLYFRYELNNGVDKVIWQWSFSHFGEY